jgi:hypothetical protein
LGLAVNRQSKSICYESSQHNSTKCELTFQTVLTFIPRERAEKKTVLGSVRLRICLFNGRVRHLSSIYTKGAGDCLPFCSVFRLSKVGSWTEKSLNSLLRHHLLWMNFTEMTEVSAYTASIHHRPTPAKSNRQRLRPHGKMQYKEQQPLHSDTFPCSHCSLN